jgi:hypothetical protein
MNEPRGQSLRAAANDAVLHSELKPVHQFLNRALS